MGVLGTHVEGYKGRARCLERYAVYPPGGTLAHVHIVWGR